MHSFENEIVELHAALVRARAMGFEQTAEAMQRVLDEMIVSTKPPCHVLPDRNPELGEPQ